jgi:WhiB family redox-sensing transcriptional regulator
MTGYTANTSTTAPTGHPRALCRDYLDLHFPVGGGPQRDKQTAAAKAVCRRCPLTAACLRWSLNHREPYGVWGGMCEDERSALWQRDTSPAQAAELRRRHAERDTNTGTIRRLACSGLTDQEIADDLNRANPGAGWSSGRVQATRSRKDIPSGYHVRQRTQGAA